MLIGYARVCTGDESLALQIDALAEAGCERIFQNQISGIVNTRPNLNQVLNFARSGDTLVVCRLGRLSRSLQDLIETVTLLESRGVQLKSLYESIDTASSNGKLIFHLFGVLAEFRLNLIKERTFAGLQAARARGRKGSRTPSLYSEKQKLAAKLYSEKNHSVKEICQFMENSKPTLYKYVRIQGVMQ